MGKNKKAAIDENIVAAHHTLEDGAVKIGKAAAVLMRRIEDLTSELEDVIEKHVVELNTVREEARKTEKKLNSELAAAHKLRETEVLAVRAEADKREAEMKAKCEAIEQKLARHEEKLRKVAMELS